MILRDATLADVPAIERLIRESGIALSRGYYSAEQARAMADLMFGVDTQLIVDGTYSLIEADGAIVAAGGWSHRRTLYGSDAVKSVIDPLLDPAIDPARIRAFFVAPSHARRGLASRLMEHCATAAWQAGFRKLTLLSTLAGEPLYRTFGFVADERIAVTLANGMPVAGIVMSRPLDGPVLRSPVA